ncbi:MAG: hypothetical protein HUJ25_13295 [Crocinitomicaceae bacterium]|nr:hypothetical protein [Crocinitomicaceae bacterium]
MEPHSWIFAIAGMAYVYFLAQVYDRKRVYLIRKSRIHQPDETNKEQLLKWRQEVRVFKRDLKKFRTGSILLSFVIPVIELCAHLVWGDYLLQIFAITIVLFLVFLIGLVTLLYDMRQYGSFEHKKYKSATSILYD